MKDKDSYIFHKNITLDDILMPNIQENVKLTVKIIVSVLDTLMGQQLQEEKYIACA